METTDPTRQPASPPPTPPPDPAVPSAARRLWDRISPLDHPIGWTAGCGSILVLVAAISSTTTSWADVPIAVRLAGIVALTAVVVAFAERARHTIPTSARVLAHLGAGLALPTVVSATATAHGSWRVCTLLGGIAGVVALEVQGRRWLATRLHGGEVINAAVAAAGLAALTHVPIGLILCALAIGALTIGLERRAGWLAVLAATSPFLAVLSALRFGPGTIRELGASGATLGWCAPVVGMVAGALIAYLGTRHARARLRLFALAAILVADNVIVGLVASGMGTGWPTAWTVLVAAAAVAFVLRSRPLAMAVAVVFPLQLATQLWWLGVEPSPIIATLAVLGTVAIGTSITLDRGFTPLDATGFTALVVATTLVRDETHQALLGLAVGVFAFVYGRSLKHRILRWFGIVTSVQCGLRLAGDVHLRGMQQLDVVMALVVLALAAFEARSERQATTTPRVTATHRFAAPSIVGGCYLLTAAIGTGSSMRVVVSFVAGTIAIVFGAGWRLPAVAVTGAVVAAASLAIATRRQLGTLPIWAWCLGGGLVLIAAAVTAERRGDRPTTVA